MALKWQPKGETPIVQGSIPKKKLLYAYRSKCLARSETLDSSPTVRPLIIAPDLANRGVAFSRTKKKRRLGSPMRLRFCQKNVWHSHHSEGYKRGPRIHSGPIAFSRFGGSGKAGGFRWISRGNFPIPGILLSRKPPKKPGEMAGFLKRTMAEKNGGIKP